MLISIGNVVFLKYMEVSTTCFAIATHKVIRVGDCALYELHPFAAAFGLQHTGDIIRALSLTADVDVFRDSELMLTDKNSGLDSRLNRYWATFGVILRAVAKWHGRDSDVDHAFSIQRVVCAD